MQAVILAGGVGSRLGAVTGGKPKALVEIGGRPLILHQLEALADHGVGPALVVLGYQAEELRRVIGDRAETIVNDRYAETNSLYSLWLAGDWIKGPFVLLNSDLFFDPVILERLLEETGTVIAYDSTSSRGREQTKIALKQRRVVDLGKDLPASSARGESMGLLKFDEDGARAMLQAADQLVREGHETAWVIEATRTVCGQVPVYGLNIAGEHWAEIDFPYDLAVARGEVWPAIWKGRWRRIVYWRRTRWAALVVLATVLSFGGWAASTRVGPASVDWETVPLTGGEQVRLELPGDRAQRWWSVARGEAATAEVRGGGTASIEARLVLPEPVPDTLRYVVAVLVDGTEVDWRALTAHADTGARLTGGRVGDRDRIRIPLPPGTHQVGAMLTAGHAERLLVRVRQPEERQD